MATQEETREFVLDESELQIVQSALEWYIKRPHLPSVQQRIKAFQRRLELAVLGLEE